jgi:3-isopropylmalate/(R)-2-methylmalate dehydratase small subunit
MNTNATITSARVPMRGRAWVFGNNIDTDIIAPAGTISFGLGDKAEDDDVKRNAFRAVRPDLYKVVRSGDVLVAGSNFGLGSHREPANRVLVSLGFSAVICESVARLFFRNSVAIGFYVFEVPGILAFAQEGDELEIDLESSLVRNLTRETSKPLPTFSPLIRNIIDQRGILAMMKKRLQDRELA